MLGISKKHERHLQKWTKHHKTAINIGIAIVGLLLATALVVVVLNYNSPEPITATKATTPPKPKPAGPKYYSPLTGVSVPDKTSTEQAVTAVMIENSLAARPQSGLKDAGVVFEAIAEGGITRFLVLYQESRPQLVGPVRSVRLYYVDWVTPFNASIAHVGGSQAALNLVRGGNYRDIDQFFNGKYYWRATDRAAPHNVYTSFDNLDNLNRTRGYTTSTFTAWPRVNGNPAKAPTATTIDVKISGPLYNSHYEYDKSTNTYKRYEGGTEHLDREAGNITPSVVIVMDTQMQLVEEDGNREQITTIGSGPAHIFQNGTVTTGTWNKADRGSQIEFLDANGKPVQLVRGQTWVTAVPANQGGGVSWK